MLPTIEYAISLGNILTILAVVGSVFTFIWTMKSDILTIRIDVSYLQDSLKTLTETFSQLGKILTQIAVQDQRINMVEKRVDEIAHGKGLVT